MTYETTERASSHNYRRNLQLRCNYNIGAFPSDSESRSPEPEAKRILAAATFKRRRRRGESPYSGETAVKGAHKLVRDRMTTTITVIVIIVVYHL